MSLSANIVKLAETIGKYIKSSILPRLLPTGGTAGQVLVKNSANENDVSWGNVGANYLEGDVTINNLAMRMPNTSRPFTVYGSTWLQGTNGRASLRIVPGNRPNTLIPGDVWIEQSGMFYTNNNKLYPVGSLYDIYGAIYSSDTLGNGIVGATNLLAPESATPTTLTPFQGRNASMVLDSNISLFGSTSLKLTVTGRSSLNSISVYLTDTNSLVPVEPNTKYTLSFYVLSDREQMSENYGTLIYSYNSDKVSVRNGNGIRQVNPVPSSSTKWTKHEIEFITSATEYYLRPSIEIINALSNQIFWIDCIALYKGSSGLEWNEGGKRMNLISKISDKQMVSTLDCNGKLTIKDLAITGAPTITLLVSDGSSYYELGIVDGVIKSLTPTSKVIGEGSGSFGD